jgi:hypothetical protein
MKKQDLLIYSDSVDLDYQKLMTQQKVYQSIISNINKMWDVYYEYADNNFPKQLSVDFWPRIWEMNLTYILICSGYLPNKKNGTKGPDITLDTKKSNINIEAVCPTPGAVGLPDTIQTNTVDIKDMIDNNNFVMAFKKVETEKIELRLQSVIKEKKDKFTEYLKKETIGHDDINIISISANRIPWSNFMFGDDMGIEINILRSILPIGAEVCDIESMRKGQFTTRLEYKKNNIKNNGSEVNKSIFENKEYSCISAIIYSIHEFPLLHDKSNRNIFIIKNPYAKNILETNFGFNEIFVEIKDRSCTFKKLNY